MSNSVFVNYPADSTDPIQVQYSIERAEDLHTVTCAVDAVRFPIWLQLRKFSISSRKESGGYITLFNEVNNSKNMDTSLFIDLVYSSIMKLEHFKLT